MIRLSRSVVTLTMVAMLLVSAVGAGAASHGPVGPQSDGDGDDLFGNVQKWLDSFGDGDSTTDDSGTNDSGTDDSGADDSGTDDSTADDSASDAPTTDTRSSLQDRMDNLFSGMFGDSDRSDTPSSPTPDDSPDDSGSSDADESDDTDDSAGDESGESNDSTEDDESGDSGGDSVGDDADESTDDAPDSGGDNANDGSGSVDDETGSDDARNDADDGSESTGDNGVLDRDNVERYIHQAVNEERAERGLGELAFDDDLRNIARLHSEDMAQRGYFSHTTPDGKTVSDRYADYGYDCRAPAGDGTYYTSGENIAYTYYDRPVRTSSGEVVEHTTERELAYGIVDQWMNSDSHRENMLAGHWNNEGIGIYVTDENRVYATQNFC